jgi:hypothetical protein
VSPAGVTAGTLVVTSLVTNTADKRMAGFGGSLFTMAGMHSDVCNYVERVRVGE